MNDGLGTGRSTKLRDRLPRDGDGGDPVAQVMGRCARRLSAPLAARSTGSRLPSLPTATTTTDDNVHARHHQSRSATAAAAAPSHKPFATTGEPTEQPPGPEVYSVRRTAIDQVGET